MARMDRRSFLYSSISTGLAAAKLAAAPKAKTIKFPAGLPARKFGKTGIMLPVLGMGGSAFIDRYAKELGVEKQSREYRIAMIRHAYASGVRYFDTARVYEESEGIYGEAIKDFRANIYLATKVWANQPSGPRSPEDARASVEESLRQVKVDYFDSVQIHMPVDYDRAMKTYDVLVKLREEGKLRYIGCTNHTNFDLMYKLISTGGFDQVLLAYGYFPKGLDQIISDRMREYRNMTIAKAYELGTAVVAMKVLGARVLSHAAKNVVPDFPADKLPGVAAAAIKWVLADERISVMNIGASYREDIDKNVALLKGNTKLTPADRELLADFSRQAYESPEIKSTRIV
jgi:aryl-alcohol dehydrogenase-like predicted oxidoreductase